jgi:hypothetical protein
VQLCRAVEEREKRGNGLRVKPAMTRQWIAG